MKKQGTKFTTQIALFILLIGITVGVALGMAAYKTNFFGLGKAPVVAVIDTAKQNQITQIVHDLKENLKIDAAGFMNAADAAEKGRDGAFSKQVFDLGMQLDNEIAKSLALTPEAKEEADEALKANFPSIADSARANYLRRIKTLQAVEVNQISSTLYRTKSEILAASLNSLVSSMANLILIPLGIHVGIAGNLVASFALQSPTETLLAPVMQPIGDELYKLGIVRDLQASSSKLILQRSSALAEMATAEMDIKDFESRKVTRHVSIGDYNLFSYVAANGNLEFNCQIKFGFDLTRFFKITRDDNLRIINIDLPSPQLISVDQDLTSSTINSGLFSELSNIDILYANARKNAITLAEEKGIQTKAKIEMQNIIRSIFSTFCNDPKFRYQVNVNFLSK